MSHLKMPKLDECIERASVVLFLLSMTLSVRKIFLDVPLGSDLIFNEYTDVSLYLSDISLGLVVAIIVLRNKTSILSIVWWKALFHMKYFNRIVLSPLPLVLWSFLSAFWSKNALLAIYTSGRLLEGYILYVIVIYLFVPRGTKENSNQLELFRTEQAPSCSNVPRGTLRQLMAQTPSFFQKCSTWNLYLLLLRIVLLIGLSQAIIGLIQFVRQSSLGMTFLKESMFQAGQTGVAKFVFFENAFIRPYGLFPHPNLLAFFLGVTLLLSFFYPWIAKSDKFHVEHIWIYRFLLGIQLIVFLFTFSKTGYIGMILVCIYVYSMFHVEHIKVANAFVPRGTWKFICSTWNNYGKYGKMFHVELLLLFVSLLIVILSLFSGINRYFAFEQPLLERNFLVQGLTQGIVTTSGLGVGSGQWVLNMQDFYKEKLEIWQFQPIHNVFFLVFGELGFIGLGFFIIFFAGLLFQSFQVPRGTNKLVNAILIFLITSMFFDHYLWDIQQGILFFWLILGGAAGSLLRHRLTNANNVL